MSRNSLLEAGTKSEGEVTATGLEPRITQFLNHWVRVQLQSQQYVYVNVFKSGTSILTC